VHSAPFTFESTEELIALVEGRSKRRQPEYSRMGNPTVTATEARLAALEGAEAAQLFASGMAAVTTLFLRSLCAGDHLVLTRDCYKRTRDFATLVLPDFGIRTDVVEPCLGAIGGALTPRTRLVFTETPTNPALRVVDLEGLAELGRERQLLTVADTTFATPMNLRPLELGIDLVVHSATKYLGGHNDLVAGLVAGSAELMEPLTEFHKTQGAVCDPHTAFLLDRGLKTLALRVTRHNANGLAVARSLEGHPAVESVLYPGLESHPDHDVAQRLMAGFGGVVTFFLKGGLDETRRFVDGLSLCRIAPSLGGTESLVEPVVVMGYWDTPPEEREALGIRDNMVRLSAGIEEAEDICADLEQALAAV
jgi:cystathionine gamma-synthase